MRAAVPVPTEAVSTMLTGPRRSGVPAWWTGLLAGFLCVVLTQQSVQAAPARYTLRVAHPDAQRLQVEAQFELQSNQIGMYITAAPELENGQADLVDNLVVQSADHRFDIIDLGSGDWQLEGAQPGTQVTVQYEILLEHGNYNWRPGRDEVGYRTSEGLFFTGSSLFIVAGNQLPDGAEIRFDLPEGWRASHPWRQKNGAAWAPRLTDLVRNCMFLGSHREETVQLGDFTFRMVIGGDLWEKRQLFRDAMEPVLPAAREIFQGMPNESQYLVVFNRGGRNDGGAFTSSYSMMLQGEVNEASSVIWGHGVAHELIHFWNGHTLRPESDQEEWFKEGFTDYLTILVRSRAGLDSPERVYRKIENSMRRYLLSKLVIGIEGNLRDAGAKKHQQRMYVYGGGTLVAFALDLRIRQATSNARGLDDFMAAMFEQFGKTKKTYDLEDIANVATQVSGEDQREWFQRYVQGTALLNVAPLAAIAGLQLDTMADEFFLSARPDAPSGAREIRESLFGRPSTTVSR